MASNSPCETAPGPPAGGHPDVAGWVDRQFAAKRATASTTLATLGLILVSWVAVLGVLAAGGSLLALGASHSLAVAARVGGELGGAMLVLAATLGLIEFCVSRQPGQRQPSSGSAPTASPSSRRH